MNVITTDFQEEEWYTIRNADQLDSPALVFYPDRIAENINRLKASIDHIERLRPHVKTHKSDKVTELLLDAGITKFKCATIAEAEMLGNCGAPDVLLAYQLVGPKIERFIRLIKTFPFTKFACLLDNEQSAISLSTVANDADIKISVYLDINVGMGRTGITPGDEAIILYQKISRMASLQMLGLHIYDGHIHDAAINSREEQWHVVWQSIVRLRSNLLDKGFPKPVIVAGGTPTFPFYARQKDVECSPGTFILWDKGYQDAFTEQQYLPAALILSRVISITGDNRFSLDLGHKSVAAENELLRRVFFINAPNVKVVSQSEEHLIIEHLLIKETVTENSVNDCDMAEPAKEHVVNICDVFYGLPIHICPTVALYERAAIVYNHALTGEWNIISRDRKITI